MTDDIEVGGAVGNGGADGAAGASVVGYSAPAAPNAQLVNVEDSGDGDMVAGAGWHDPAPAAISEFGDGCSSIVDDAAGEASVRASPAATASVTDGAATPPAAEAVEIAGEGRVESLRPLGAGYRVGVTRRKNSSRMKIGQHENQTGLRRQWGRFKRQ